MIRKSLTQLRNFTTSIEYLRNNLKCYKQIRKSYGLIVCPMTVPLPMCPCTSTQYSIYGSFSQIGITMHLNEIVNNEFHSWILHELCSVFLTRTHTRTSTSAVRDAFFGLQTKENGKWTKNGTHRLCCRWKLLAENELESFPFGQTRSFSSCIWQLRSWRELTRDESGTMAVAVATVHCITQMNSFRWKWFTFIRASSLRLFHISIWSIAMKLSERQLENRCKV